MAVETHLEHIYAKLGIHTRYQLITAAATGSWALNIQAVPRRPITRLLPPSNPNQATQPLHGHHEEDS